MIIPNGTIEIKYKVAGGIDPVTGYPSKPTSVLWSDPIDCQYLYNKHNNLGKVNGESFTISAYTVLIEDQPLPPTTEQLRLKNREGAIIGEYSIILIEPLETVGQIKIMI